MKVGLPAARERVGRARVSALGSDVTAGRNKRAAPRFHFRRDGYPKGAVKMDLLTIELARARLRLNEAKEALKCAEQMLDHDCGASVGVALCCRIRHAQQRVDAARIRLSKLHDARIH